MYDAVAVGELLIDFTPVGGSENDMLFKALPGGAPCNVLAMLSKLGKKTAFIGKVGNDPFGLKLAQAVKSENIDISGIVFDNNAPTTLALVQLDSNGDRSFSFYRNPGADIMLNTAELNEAVLTNTRLLHFGSVSLSGSPSREATIKAVETAKSNGAIISFDPNFRPFLWSSNFEAKSVIKQCLKFCDILKVSEEELYFLTSAQPEKGCLNAVKSLCAEHNTPLVFITLGKNGSICFYKNKLFKCKCDGRIKPINTTGAGDAFFGAVLSCIAQKYKQGLSDDEIMLALKYANTAAGIVTTRHGALAAMPNHNEIASKMDYDEN